MFPFVSNMFVNGNAARARHKALVRKSKFLRTMPDVTIALPSTMREERMDNASDTQHNIDSGIDDEEDRSINHRILLQSTSDYVVKETNDTLYRVSSQSSDAVVTDSPKRPSRVRSRREGSSPKRSDIASTSSAKVVVKGWMRQESAFTHIVADHRDLGFDGPPIDASNKDMVVNDAGSSTMIVDEPIVQARIVRTQAAMPFVDTSGNNRLLIKGGHVVNDDSIIQADVLIDDGLVAQVAPNLQPPPGVKVIDATGKFAIPGGIDAQTHFSDIFMGATSVDDFHTGTMAALAGGTTMVIDLVNPAGNETLKAAFDRYRKMGDDGAVCDYALSVLVPQFNRTTANDMHLLAKEGVNSFLFSMAYREQGLQVDDAQLYQAMITCKKVGSLMRVHAENGDIIKQKQEQMLALGITGPEGHLQSRPDDLEAEATNRACVLGRQINCPLYVTRVTSKGAADVIAKHRKNGAIVYGEPVCAALSTDGTHYFNECWRHAAAHVTAPPLRADANQATQLMSMLASGELHVAASDHRTHSSEQKALGRDDFTKIPHGINGVEERMAIIWEKGVHQGQMDPMRFVAVTSTNAAKLFNMYPRKGRIAVGSDADLVVWDAAVKRHISVKNHHSNADFNVFEGTQCHGQAVAVISRGRLVVDGGSVQATRGSGRFIPLSANAPYVYSVIQQREKVQQPHKIERQPYKGPGSEKVKTVTPRRQNEQTYDMRARDDYVNRSQTKINQPPGGKSSGSLW